MINGNRSSVHSHFDRNANKVGMVFGTKLLLQKRCRIGARLVGDFKRIAAKS
jgi:hypothetical protein